MELNKLASYLELHDRLQKFPPCKPQGLSPSGPEERLPYPTRKMKAPWGKPLEAYIIPEEDKEKVLKELYPFVDTPSLNTVMLDLHENKCFTVRDYLVIREGKQNYLVSPYFGSTGGSVLDWVDPEGSTEDCVQQVREPQSTFFCTTTKDGRGKAG